MLANLHCLQTILHPIASKSSINQVIDVKVASGYLTVVNSSTFSGFYLYILQDFKVLHINDSFLKTKTFLSLENSPFFKIETSEHFLSFLQKSPI